MSYDHYVGIISIDIAQSLLALPVVLSLFKWVRAKMYIYSSHYALCNKCYLSLTSRSAGLGGSINGPTTSCLTVVGASNPSILLV